MAGHWVLLIAMASLTLGEERHIPLHLMDCCRTKQVLELDFSNADNCMAPIQGLYGKGPMPDAKQVCTATDCIMRGNGLLGENNAIKKDELKKFFVDKAVREGKPTVEDALDKCFGQLDQLIKADPCQTGMEPLMACFHKEVYIHCPVKMWNDVDPQCKGAKERVAKIKPW